MSRANLALLPGVHVVSLALVRCAARVASDKKRTQRGKVFAETQKRSRWPIVAPSGLFVYGELVYKS